jgi:DNA-binding winged helix-turn-helix (wHTH) protein
VSFEVVERKGESPIRFDLFELNAKNSELRRSGVPVDLPPQALRVLVLLAGRPDELVTRKEIKEALWPGQSYGDFDSRLNFTVKKLRMALGDDAEQPRYVRTVRNAGYMFIVPVREAPAPTSQAVSSSRLTEFDGISEVRGDAPAVSLPAVSAARTDLPRRFPTIGFSRGIGVLVFIAVAAMGLLVWRQHSSRAVSGDEFIATSAGPGSMDAQPSITSVTEIVPEARQRIVIRGSGFGLHVAYAHTDSPYLALRDKTRDWAAGRVIPQNWDEVMVDVQSWTDNEIVISGFSGDYGRNGWRLAAGDDLEIAVWNPQSGEGPAMFHTKVVGAQAGR